MSQQPTSPSGYIDNSALNGIDGYGQVVDYLLEELNPELLWPYAVRTYSRMRRDPQLAAVIKAYTLAIRRAHWAVDGAGCPDEVVAFTADQLGLPILGTDDEPTGARRRGFTWAEHLRVALLDQVFGHQFFEQSWVEADGRWQLGAVQERMPQTIAEVRLNPDGTLAGIVQEAPTGTGRVAPMIRTSNNALVWYVNDREGSNYYGQSLIRPSYPAWLIKDQVLRVHATSIRRFGLGILNVEAPPGATPQQIAEAQRIGGQYKASEHANIGLPNGFVAKLQGLTGSVPDAVAFLNYLDQQMTRSTLTSLLDMAAAQRGSRALGETIMDLMVLAQQAVADAHADTATGQIVVPLVDANFGEDTPAPRVVCGDVGADVELTAQDIYWLTAYAALTNDPQLEGYIRSRYGIPKVDPDYVRPPAPAAVVAPPPGGPKSDG